MNTHVLVNITSKTVKKLNTEFGIFICLIFCFTLLININEIRNVGEFTFLFVFLDNVKLKADCWFDHQNNLCIKDVSYMWSTERTSLNCNLHSKKLKSGYYKHWTYCTAGEDYSCYKNQTNIK